MSEFSAAHVPVAIWGFLVGFVGWGSCFRLVEPIANWLSPRRAKGTPTAASQAIVAVFLIFAIITAIATLPAIVMAADGSTVRDNAYWRSLLGVAYMASLAGFFSYGFLQRFGD